jgi:hypothetical protein
MRHQEHRTHASLGLKMSLVPTRMSSNQKGGSTVTAARTSSKLVYIQTCRFFLYFESRFPLTKSSVGN